MPRERHPMICSQRMLVVAVLVALLAPAGLPHASEGERVAARRVKVTKAAAHDLSPALVSLSLVNDAKEAAPSPATLEANPSQQITSASVEQKEQGTKPAPEI